MATPCAASTVLKDAALIPACTRPAEVIVTIGYRGGEVDIATCEPCAAMFTSRPARVSVRPLGAVL